MANHQQCCGVSFWLYILIILGLVLFAGLMSGLTLGLMSLGLVDLEVLMRSGTPSDRKHAAKILPVVKNQHLLLVTLLIGNALAMEALPIFLDSLVEAWGAILLSVTLILMFGEILPQAVCTRYGLAVGAFMAPVVRVLLMVFFPVSYPISKLLDKMLGKGHVALFRRAELKTLVDMHGNEAGKGGELTHDETTIIAGALELTEKTAVHAMTPISSVFSIDINAKLDLALMNKIMSNGHSRIPVYSGSPTNIIGLILVKNLLSVRAEDEVSVRNLTIRKIPRVAESMPLYDILNEFQKGHSHMAVVMKYTKEKQDSMQRGRMQSMERTLSGKRHSRRTSDSRGINYKFLALDIPESDLPQSQSGSPSKRQAAAGGVFSDQGGVSPSTVSKFGVGNIPTAGELKTVDETHHPQPLVSQKSRRRDTGDVIIDMSPEVLNFPRDDEVVGIITMEDLIEELLQEEILDETDEYIDVHNKIKVNLQPSGGSTPASPAPTSQPAANSSFLQTPESTSPLSSPHTFTPTQTPAWNSAPESPLAALANTNVSHQKIDGPVGKLEENGKNDHHE